MLCITKHFFLFFVIYDLYILVPIYNNTRIFIQTSDFKKSIFDMSFVVCHMRAYTRVSTSDKILLPTLPIYIII